MSNTKQYPQFDKYFEVKTVYSADYNAIARLIDDNYGEAAGFTEPYDLPGLEERGSGNGEDWELNICKGSVDQRHLTPYEGRYPRWSTRTFLTDLCNKDIIPAGNYLIDISW